MHPGEQVRKPQQADSGGETEQRTGDRAGAGEDIGGRLRGHLLLRGENRATLTEPMKPRIDRTTRMGSDVASRPDEPKAWQAAADAAHVPYDVRLGVHEQSAAFTRYAPWDFAAEHPGEPLMLRAPYFQLYRRQVIKQADLVLAMHWCPEHFTAEQKARNLDYYERITTRDSSLSACTQAVMCAEVGHLELAHHYATEAALVDLVDLRDLHTNTRAGLHLASPAGAWSAIVEGFGGLCEHGSVLALAPRLPDGITGLRFRLRHSGLRLLVEADHATVRVSLRDGTAARLPILLYGEAVEVTAGGPVQRPVAALKPGLPPPEQPPGSAPDRAMPTGRKGGPDATIADRR